jgi:hypothetical protein
VKQTAFLILFDAVLSFLMLIVAGIVLLRLIPAGKVLLESNVRHRPYRELQAKYGDPAGGAQRVVWLLESVCLPIIAATIGTITGIMSKAHPVPIALLGILPIETFALSLSKFKTREVFPFIGYAAVACGTALAVSYLR